MRAIASRLFFVLFLAGSSPMLTGCLCECKSTKPLDYYYVTFQFSYEEDWGDTNTHYLQLIGFPYKYPIRQPDSYRVKLPINLNYTNSGYRLVRGSRKDSLQVGYRKKYTHRDRCGMELDVTEMVLLNSTLPPDSLHFTSTEGKCTIAIY